MGLQKKATGQLEADQLGTAEVSNPTSESGTDSALRRLHAASTGMPYQEKPTYKQRDFDAEARGKSLCLLYGHAIGSCVVAGLQFDKPEEAFAHMRFFVDSAMNEIFKDK